MDQEHAKQLGILIAEARGRQAWSASELARRSKVAQSTVFRLEQGEFLNPSPDTLAKLAEALGLNLSDVLLSAQYPITTELPSLPAYLRTKYRDLPAPAQAELQAYVARLTAEHGLTPGGPKPGEDE
jgi:transcriptional regulator with XRE-family HTH domain